MGAVDGEGAVVGMRQALAAECERLLTAPCGRSVGFRERLLSYQSGQACLHIVGQFRLRGDVDDAPECLM